MGKIIGRQNEKKYLNNLYNSGKAEFLAVYGRRRIGKTFLIREYFDNNFCFETTGVIDGSKDEQLSAFTSSLRKIGYKGGIPKNWMTAFEELRLLLEPKANNHRIVIFIDELPCFDTTKSEFLKAFGHFWNSWANWNKNVFLIVCGSATSWIVDNIVNNHGGLHNRITAQIHLHQFSLAETEEFFADKNFNFSRDIVLQFFMALGGVPYYLSLVERGESFAQFIDRTFFNNGILAQEYDRLFASLYRKPEVYIKVLEYMATNKSGVTRTDIAKGIKTDNGHLSKILSDLEYCDFIRSLHTIGRGNKLKSTGQYYQLSDFFTIFYIKFHKFIIPDQDFWKQHLNTSSINSWLGLAYERVVMCFVDKVKKAIGIEKISSFNYAWRKKDSDGQDVQIDLVINRADGIINICEVKYSSGLFDMDKNEYLKIQRRAEVLKKATKTRSAVWPIIITTNGMTNGGYSNLFPVQITMDDLF